MKGSMSLGKIRGIRIEINISWIVIFSLVTFMMASSYFPTLYPGMNPVIYWSLGISIALLMFVSILLHELSHSIVSIHLGINVSSITLFIFGGLAQIEEEPNDPVKEMKIAIAGPAMSLLLFALFTLLSNLLLFLGITEIYTVPFSYVGGVNLILAIFNLVPAFPLDGGRVLRAILWYYKGSLQFATKVASSMGDMFGYFLIFIGLYWALSGNVINGLWFVFIGWFIKQLSQSSYQNMMMNDLFTKIHVREFMTRDLVVVKDFTSVEDLVENYFYRYKYVCFPVVRNESVLGLVTIDSVKKIEREMWNQTSVGAITELLRDDLVAAPDATVISAMKKLFSNKIGRMVVIEDGKLIGIISRTDILNYIRVYSELHQ
ncbi:Zn-dependent protease (includes SpoIVFB) [Dethiosulfatibacter aminovorans DSM 17477]|uniref:Zinc metalloprotease n=1 Tax=Dethiosulfatibacter aminovorans DSM 17477 TaxID=1121476 RepID=A0A1M6GFG0_9FIRM|nr:site-2 protease family protein [Dethiosulfatibacter aminovorans]SHJ08669.1 Zn-dependent protease (includes SpoIVFB) [Dethiosulfatibacter aminovorans DSM 17477]